MPALPFGAKLVITRLRSCWVAAFLLSAVPERVERYHEFEQW